MPPPPSQADRVYAQLRLRLLRGELPESAPLVEQQLAAEYETSRTPVREALRRLEGDGHLVRDPSGRLRPSVPSLESMPELYEVRIALEAVTVRRAATGGDGGALREVHEEWLALAASRRRFADPEFVRTDERFHMGIAAAAGNAVVHRMLLDVNHRIRVLRMHEFTTPARIRATIDEHVEIIAAIRAGDPEVAVAFMRAHVQRSALYARERVDDAASRMRGAAFDR